MTGATKIGNDPADAGLPETTFIMENGDYKGWTAWNGGSLSWTGSRMRITSSGSLSGAVLTATPGFGFPFEKGKSYVIAFNDIATSSGSWTIQDFWGTVESKPTAFKKGLPNGDDTSRGWAVFRWDQRTDNGRPVVYNRTAGQTFDFASYTIFEVAPNTDGSEFVADGRNSLSFFQGVAIGDEARVGNNQVAIGANANAEFDDTYDVGGSSGPADAIGFGAQAMLWRSIAIGEYAWGAAVSSLAVGANTYCSLRHGVALGRGAMCPTTDAWIDLSGQPYPPTFALGGEVGDDINIYFGNGWAKRTDLNPNGIAQKNTVDATAVVTRFHGQGGWDGKATPTETDNAAGPIYICGGASTGTADGGVAGFQITVASGVSSNTVNPLLTAFIADPATTGNTYLQAYNKGASALQEVGDIIFQNFDSSGFSGTFTGLTTMQEVLDHLDSLNLT